MELKEIINGTGQLMENFKSSAPGTFKHCLAVSSLCESIGRELDLDIEYLTAAAMLHDIGKINTPSNFIENIADEKNIHDELDPRASYKIISSHLSDGVLKLVQLGLPIEIIRIISTHHGDSVVKSIYNKTKKGTVEDHYRYKSSKVNSVEGAVLMCTDVVESACRALHSANKLEDHKNTIDSLINSLVEDEQLDILKIGELRIIKKVLTTEVKNIYHNRIDYDSDDDKNNV